MAALSSPIHISDAEAPPEWLTVEQVADMLGISPKALCDQIARQPENPRPVAKWFITPAIKDGKKSRFTLEQAHEMASLKTKKKAASALNLGLALDDGNDTKENAPTTNEGADKNTLFDSTDYTPVSHSGGLSPVFSLFDSIGSKTPCQRITYGDLVAMARNPAQVAKKAAPCFVPANVSAKTVGALASAEGYALIVADVDIHTTQGTIRCFLERCGITKALIYSTASSTPENHKNRVVIPLRAYCGYEQWAMLTSWLCCQLAGDATAERKTQVSFVPNRGAHYAYDEINTGEALDPQDSSHAAIRAAQDHAKALEAIEGDKQALALERALERENKRETAPSLANGGLSLIGAFNESYSVEMLLQKNGYKHKGRNKWLCPNSASGIAGAVILKDPQTGLERVYSHHSPESDPLANGRAHDAFSVFTALEHGGDEKSAVKAAGEMLPEITKANQDAYRKTKHTEHLERERQERLTPANEPDVSQSGGDDERPVFRLEQCLLDLGIPPDSDDCGWTLKHWLPFGEVTLLAGHGGSGKSYVALVLAVHVALGLHFGDVETTKGRVLFVSCEDSGRTVKQRLGKISHGIKTSIANIGQNLDVLDLSDHDAILYSETMADRAMVATPTARELMRLVSARNYSLVVVDNASETFGGNEINRQQVRGFIRMLRQGLANVSASVLLLAHINKMSAKDSSDNEDYSGSTAWHNSVRSRISLANGQQEGQLLLKHQNLTMADYKKTRLC